MSVLIGASPLVTYATATNTTPVLGGGKGFTVGARMAARNGKEYVFAQSATSIAVGDVVAIASDTGIAAGLTTATSAASETIGVAQVALASGDYGWVQIYGACGVKVLGSAVKAVPLFSTVTAGSLDDATASNYLVSGIQILSTNPSATATVMSAFIAYPKVRIMAGVLG